MAFRMKRFTVHVNGFSPLDYDAASIGKARSKAWQSYCSYRHVAFKEFLKISRVTKADTLPEGYGRKILISGRPGYWVGHNGQYIRFVRDDQDCVLSSHPLDVTEIPTSPETNCGGAK